MEQKRDEDVFIEDVANEVNMNIKAEEIVVECNLNDYADFIGDGSSLSHAVEQPIAKQTKNRRLIRGSLKRPGALSPYSLFLQEIWPKHKKENPGLSFTDMGKIVGEMWQNLDVASKEDYKRRAKEVSSTRFLDWRKESAQLREDNMRKPVMMHQSSKIFKKLGVPTISARGGRGVYHTYILGFCRSHRF